MSKTNVHLSIKEDLVSLCIICKEDMTVLLLSHNEVNGTYFPCMPVIQNSWRLTMKKLTSTFPGVSGKESSVLRVTRFWQPDGLSVSHVIYRVKCPWSEKKMTRTQGRAKWFSLEQVQQLSASGCLSSPELLEYVTQSLQPTNVYPVTTDPEAAKEGFDVLNEVLEKHVIIDPEQGLSQQEQLLKAAHFSKNEQKKIYKEFLLRTFPNLLINQTAFDKFMAELGWTKDEWPGLFKCVDESSRGGLTFKEFLLFLAATEPDTPHGSNSGMIRCDYIFRYFDKNKDNVLDQNELKALIVAIQITKGSPKDVEKSLAELGLGPKPRLSLNTFVKKVGEFKFRGTSVIFRSKNSVLKLFSAHSVGESNNPPPTSAVTQPNTKKTRNFPPILSWGGTGNKADEGDNIKWDNKPGLKDFEIGTYVVKLSSTGVIEDIKPVDRIFQGKSVSMGHQEQFTRFTSVQYYNEKTTVNELLKALQYFNDSSPVSSRTPKKPLSWGLYDTNQFMSLLLNVCGDCQRILESEPRMLQLSSPVYIMGDLHGNYHDLSVYEQVLWSLGLILSPCSLLFLGDYVDRGPYGVEIVAYLFAQKVKNPNKIFLLRGNHEIRNVQRNFTFYHECLRKFGEQQGHDLWNTINKVFDVMPLAAVVDTKLFCCHGGIPPPWMCPRIEHINSIQCPLVQPEEESMLAWDIMWNDPVKSDQMTAAIYQEMEANEGFANNTNRKTGRFFSAEALDTFLKRNDLSHVIRAHEVRAAGFQVQQGGKLLTVFSSSGYCGGNNEAACILVTQDCKLRILLLNTTEVKK